MLRAWLILVLWLAPISVEAKVGEFIGDDFLNQCTTANSDWTPRDTRPRTRNATVHLHHVDLAPLCWEISPDRS
jgi:hypothetical protein